MVNLLREAYTAGCEFPYSPLVIHAMDGFFWTTLCDAIAVPSRPESGFFDPYADPFDRASYVEFEGRSILRPGALPGPWTNGPPWDDKMTYAAIVD